MRSTGHVHSSRSRSKDQEPIAPTPASLHGPTSFFLATEDMLSKDHDNTNGRGIDSSFGVKTLQETPDDTVEEHRNLQGSPEHLEDHGRRRSTLKVLPNAREQSLDDSSAGKGRDSESPLFGFPRLAPTLPSVSSLSQNSTDAHPSLPSSPKSSSSRSYRPSELDSVDDGTSQAIASSEDEADTGQAPEPLDTAPQLVMPSIQMPSRRPFTERGRTTGRLKILLAGDSGLGKTSLIKSFVQLCEDIVHVDPVTPMGSSVEQLVKSKDGTSLQKATNQSTTTQVNEVWASTKAHPEWWAEIEENRLQRRRKSIGGTILERNICFVDTPGYGRGLSITEGIKAVISYIEEQVARPFSAGSTNELASMLSGNGGLQVDVVLYLIGPEIKPADLDFLQRLSQLTCVIPLVAQADRIPSESLPQVKSSVSKELDHSGIACFNLGTDDSIKLPYAVCSASSNDEDNMDASLLMSSEYIQPLLPSELSLVIDHLLQPHNIARLRHLSAKKLVQSKTAVKLLSLGTADTSMRSAHPSSCFTSDTLPQDPFHPLFHTQDRLAEYTRQEEKRAQIRLAKWANDLRKTMRDERAQFEELQQLERTTWLSKRLEECQQDTSSLDNEKNIMGTKTIGLVNSSNDPLGLLRYDESLRRHGWQIFQIVGTFGLFGAAAWWIAREWSSSTGWVIRADGCADWTFSWMQDCRPSIY
ncbi:MAG: hypothetical protein LQ337_004334 [Flavoplaca oasis]|nr:MAG: hypothetical protein LQ337_004334 [Flavoplaca oasis]